MAAVRRLSTLLIVMWSAACLAHPGGLDASGGHHNRKTGGYHYHRGGPSVAPAMPVYAPSLPTYVPSRLRGAAAAAGGRRTSGYRSKARTSVRTRVRDHDEEPKPVRTAPPDLLPMIREIDRLLNGNETAADRAEARIKLTSITETYEGTPEASEALRLLRIISEKEQAEQLAVAALEREQAEAEERERKAAAKLKLARKFIVSRKLTTAREWMQDVIDTYPETKAAAEARESIEQLDAIAKLQGLKFGAY